MSEAAPIIIFGVPGGIGEALARRLAASGRPIFLVGRREEAVGPLAGALGARYAVCDVRAPDEVAQAVGRADSGAGIAGLAYCVGSIVLKPLAAVTDADFVDAYRLNTVGAALAVQAARKGLALARGSVVLFSTVAVAQGFANHAVIAAAKGGVEGLTRSLAAELAPDVRVNAIAPSLLRTGLARGLTENPAMAKGIASMHPLPRLGEAEDVAGLAALLLSPEGGWITGQVIGVDGGRGTLRTKG